MRVALDARYLKRRDVGISVYIRGIVRALAASGAELTLVTDDSAHAVELVADHDVRAVALPGRSGFAWEQRRLPGWLRRERPDAYIAGANYGLPLVRGGARRTVLVVHDLIPLRLPRLYARQGPGWIAKYLLSTAISLRAADDVIAPSEATARDLRRLGRRRVHVRPPELPAVPASPAGVAAPEGWPERYVLYNGGRDPRKNVPLLIEAFGAHRRAGGDHHLVLMGRGYEAYDALLRRHEISDATFLPGFVPDEVKAQGLGAAAAVVYPSRWEGYGLPLVEAFAAGVPVVAGRGGSQPEVGGDAAIYVDVADPRSIAAGIREAVTPESRLRAREAGRRRLEELRADASGDPLLRLLDQPAVRERRLRR